MLATTSDFSLEYVNISLCTVALNDEKRHISRDLIENDISKPSLPKGYPCS